MKVFAKLILIFTLLFFSIQTYSFSFTELIWWTSEWIEVDCGDEECNIQSGIDIVKDTVNWIETERTFSEYVQDIVKYLLGFVSIVAIIYIIYAWFRILTWNWNEDTLKKQKMTILYVIIWILTMWLAYSIVKFVMNVLVAQPA